MRLGLALLVVSLCACEDVRPLPDVDALPERPELPDPFVAFDGSTVEGAQDFRERRRPELLRLFSHYVYGFSPPPAAVVATPLAHEDDLAGGVYDEVELRYGPQGTPPLSLALFRPRGTGPFPVFLIINKCGNQGVTADPRVLPTRSAIAFYCGAPGAETRGVQASSFPLETILARGYAVATFQSSDVEEDAATPEARAAGIRAFLPVEATAETSWGVIGAWAYGMSRAVDYLVAAPGIDGARIAVVGHSRWAKTALWAGAQDERIKLVVSQQSGTAGVKVTRSLAGEPVSFLTLEFPHWLDAVFPRFADRETRLPIDQHLLVALVAPRAFLAVEGDTDAWADPAGSRRSVEAADVVWKRLGSDGATTETDGTFRLDAPLVWRSRPGGHSLGAEDWAIFLDHADRRL